MPTTERGFAELAERHRRELHVHCYRMLGSFDEAEDLVQESRCSPTHGSTRAGRRSSSSCTQRSETPMGDWRLVPIGANTQPAAASYLRPPGETTFSAFKIDVLRVVDGQIAETPTFGAAVFAAFRLEETL